MNAAMNRAGKSSLSSRSRMLTIRNRRRSAVSILSPTAQFGASVSIRADLAAGGAVEPVPIAGHERRA
jgi:hypothetical protein